MFTFPRAGFLGPAIAPFKEEKGPVTFACVAHSLVRVPCAHCLVGLVVKASASRADDPRFESRLRRDFSGVESYQ